MFFEMKLLWGYVKLKKKGCYFEVVFYIFCGDDVIVCVFFFIDVMKWLFKENIV